MTSENAAGRPAQSAESTSENTQRPIPSDLETVAATLRAATANLDRHIAGRADELAAPRIAAAEQDAANRIADIEAAAAIERQRVADLHAELRRQLDIAHRQLAHMAWLVRFLPEPLRMQVLPAGASQARHPYPRPDEQFVAAASAAAAGAGLEPYADHLADAGRTR